MKRQLKQIWHQRLIDWRHSPVTVRIDHPTRLDRARSLGYKAKPGFVLVRQRVLRGGRQRQKFKGGRKSKNSSRREDIDKSYKLVAEERAARKYVNCEVLNSYYVASDGKNAWFEVILVDRCNPHIMADSNINWICSQRGRIHRGLTSAAIKSRGLRNKGKGAEKVR